MSQFVDECQLNVRGGDGGAGAVVPAGGPGGRWAGPNGGDGGKGGDVWLVADHNVASLLAFRDHPHRRADERRRTARARTSTGGAARTSRSRCREGTVVRDLYTGEVLAELVDHGDRWLAAAGGRGGRGNARFLSNRRRAPTFAEQGEHGEERWLRLELQLMADVALVGFPNVGKSTLISVISAAKPKIADYPFTTLEPHLGVVRLDDATEFVVADIPGLIEGASEGAGLGHQFLRHVERARVLCLLVDLAALDGDDAGRAGAGAAGRARRVPAGAARAAAPRRRHQGRHHRDDRSRRARVRRRRRGRFVISAVTGDGVSRARRGDGRLVHEARQAEPAAEGVVLLRPAPVGAAVERVGDGEFRVSGRDVERVVALNDVTTPDALAYISHRLDGSA